MNSDLRSTLLPVVLAGVVAVAAGAVVLVGFDQGGADAASAPAAVSAAAGSTTTARAASSPAAATAPAPAAPLPRPGCTALARELDAVDTSLAGLIGEDAPGPDDAIPGAAAIVAFARALDRLEASAPAEIREQVQTLARLQLAPLAALTPKSREAAYTTALTGLADAVQSAEYLDESDAVRTWVASHCG